MVIFLDIDGTMLPGGAQAIPEETVAAIAAARKNGHLAIINTGRAKGNLDAFIQQTSYAGERIFDGYITACGVMGELHGRRLWCDAPGVAVWRQVIAAAQDCGADVFYEDDRQIGYDLLSPHTVKRMDYLVREAMHGKTVSRIEGKDICFHKLVAYLPNCREPDRFRAELRDFVGMTINRDWEEFVPVGCNKGTGLRRMMAHLDLPLTEAVAVGDSENDLSMLRLCPNGAAMGNGEAKGYDVPLVTTSIEEGGVACLLRRLGLIA